MNIRGSCYVSSYQKGKAWAERKFRYINDKSKRNLIDTFEWYKSYATRTNSGVKLTPSKRQFYYGASVYLKRHLKEEPIKLFK